MKKIFLFPSENLMISIPVVLVLGFVAGLFLNITFLKDYILIFTFLMIYPTMIGFKIREAIDLSHMRVVVASSIVNFVLIPLLAIIMGQLFLTQQPQLYAGLIMISLFPTSGMTISWTMISKGNVSAAIKITAISLMLGSFLAPLYLYYIVGAMIEVDVIGTFITVIQIVVLPMILGQITYKLLMKKYSSDQFNSHIKPYLPAFSIWAMIFIIFTSISLKSKMIVQHPEIISTTLLLLIGFYIINFAMSTIIGRQLFSRADSYAFVYGTVMRNLSIALGLAIASFGPDTALIITIAFILQVQGGAYYSKLENHFGCLNTSGKDISNTAP
ncbi:MAG: arsenic resistance protein [Tissierellales bacterium]|nr:arsenic resistance protein [Tissierellales bacterium]MBN2827167.1 arsenic resistance protein [Tissierellales bacterium]